MMNVREYVMLRYVDALYFTSGRVRGRIRGVALALKLVCKQQRSATLASHAAVLRPQNYLTLL